jgi:amino acid transporter
VLIPGLAQIAPAFNLFFTTGVMVALAGVSAPLIFLISMVGMVATASTLAQFSGVYPSAGSFLTYIARSIGPGGVGGGRGDHAARLHHRVRRYLHLRRQLHHR